MQRRILPLLAALAATILSLPALAQKPAPKPPAKPAPSCCAPARLISAPARTQRGSAPAKAVKHTRKRSLARAPQSDRATCTGSAACRACKNCKYCRHCAKGGGKCGVCR